MALGVSIFDSPAPLQAWALDDSVTGHAKKVGQDSFNWYLYESDGTTLINEDLANASNIKTWTGLNEDTTYIIKCEAVSGGSKSPILQKSVTTILTPLHYYLMSGLEFAVTNDFGNCTNATVNELYSFLGTSNNLTPISGTKSVLWDRDTKVWYNIKPNVSLIEDKASYEPATDYVFAGDFFIALGVTVNNLGVGSLKALRNSGDANVYLDFSQTHARFSWNGQFISIAFPSACNAHAENVIVWGRIETTFYVSNDGGQTFASGAGFSGTLTIDLVWPGSTALYVHFLLMYNKSVTWAQIQNAVNIENQDEIETPANTIPTVLKGLTPSGTIVDDDYLTDADFGPIAFDGIHWVSLLTFGDYDFCLVSGKYADYSPDFIYVRKISTGEFYDRIDLGYNVAGTNEHNRGSIFRKGNTLYHAEFSDHYDGSVPSALVIKQFGIHWNMNEFTILPKGNNLVISSVSKGQYPQYMRGVNYDHILYQEKLLDGRFICLARSKDNFNTFEKIRILDTGGSGIWSYAFGIYAEDGVLRIRVIKYEDGASIVPDKIVWCGLLVSDDDGETIRNMEEDWSQNVSDNALPVSIADAITNCTIDPAYTSATNSIGNNTMYYDPTDGMIYGLAANGTDDGLNLTYWNGSAWVVQEIDVQGLDVIYAFGEDGSQKEDIMGGMNSFLAVRTGGSSFTFFVWVDLGAGKWKVVELSTTDYGANCTIVGDVTDDDTKQHIRMAVSHNLHFTGGSTAYNGNKTFTCARIQSTTLSDLFIKSI